MENLFGRLKELLPPPLCCCEHDDLVANFMLVGAFSGYCEIPQRFVDSSTGHLAPPLSSRNIYICDVDNQNLLICPLPGAVSLCSPWSAASCRPRIMAELH